MTFSLTLLLAAYLPTIIFYGVFTIGIMMLILSFGLRGSVRTIGMYCAGVPVALYLAAVANAEIKEWATEPVSVGAQLSSRLIVHQDELHADAAIALLAKGGLSSIIMGRGRRLEEISLTDPGRCTREVDATYRWKDHRYEPYVRQPPSLDAKPFVEDCLRKAPITPETVTELMAEEPNFVLLSGHHATAGQQFNYLLNVPTAPNQVYEMRLRGQGQDKLVGYWEVFSGRPAFPPVFSATGFETERVRRQPPAPQGLLAFVLGVLDKGELQTAAR
jgi:hypothetical protein